jgi:hypothetical protein
MSLDAMSRRSVRRYLGHASNCSVYGPAKFGSRDRRPDASRDGSSVRMAVMAHCADKTHFVDKQTLARLNSALMLGAIGSGIAACVLGALIYDIGRLVGW